MQFDKTICWPLCQIIQILHWAFHIFYCYYFFIFTHLALKHFTQLKYFLNFLFLSLLHLYLSNNKIHFVVTHWICLLSHFHRLRNLLVLKLGLYLEATSQLICFFLNLCHRIYSVQKMLIQVSSFHGATTLRVWDSKTHKNVLQIAEKQNKAKTMVIANKHRIRNVPKWSEDLAIY